MGKIQEEIYEMICYDLTGRPAHELGDNNTPYTWYISRLDGAWIRRGVRARSSLPYGPQRLGRGVLSQDSHMHPYQKAHKVSTD
jgi:hypothetical protein